MATPERSICFREAYDMRKNGLIQLEDYLKHIVAHYGGLRHETDAEDKWTWLNAGFENEVRKITLAKDYQPLGEDATGLLYSIFLSAFKEDFPTIQNLLDSSSLTVQTYLGPLVAITEDTGNARLLRLCLDLGYEPTGYNESNGILQCRTKKAPSKEWLDVLYDFDFRQWRTDSQQLNNWNTWKYVFNMGPDCVRWWIDHGGATESARGLFEDFYPEWPGSPAFQVLLDHFGVEWFTNSGTLQLAVKKQDFETVKMLVEAGADVNEDVKEWNYDVREHRSAPLPALYMAVYGKSEQMIRYLVDHGAKLPRKDIEDPYNLTPKEVKPFEQLVVELGGIE